MLSEDGRFWLIEAEPHVRLRLKDVFRQVEKSSTDMLKLSNNIQNCKDLEWFTSRYPLDMTEDDRYSLSTGSGMYDRRQADLERIILPDYTPRAIDMAKPLRHYQAVAVEMLLKAKRILCGDDVGLGKTVVAIGAMVAERATLPAMVVCQTHLPIQWKDMCEEFAPNLKVHIVRTRRAYSLPPADVYLFGYSKLQGWDDLFISGYFRFVVFDECQELRREGSNKYLAAKKAAGKAGYSLGLSATPIYNYGDEIWNIYNVISPDQLGSEWEFSREWCSGYGSKKVKDPKALGAYLVENHLMIRRTRKEVGRELPPVNKIVQTVEYNEEYVKRTEEELKLIAARVMSGSYIEKGQAAQELNVQARKMTGIAKAHGVAAYIKVLLESGERVLLAGWHRDVYDVWLKALADFKPVMYTGTESPVRKEKTKQAFISGKSPLMIISLRSGIGLDGLQYCCDLVAFGELDWSPGVHHQITGRVDRDGHEGQVTAVYLVTDSGTDPLMIDVLGLKSSQSEGIMNPDGEDFLKTTSDDRRMKLLAAQILEGR